MPWNLRLEVAEADPVGAAIQVHFRNCDSTPLRALREHGAGVVEDGGDHPVARHILVCAADDIDVVLASTGTGQLWVAAPNGPGDHLGAVVCQFAGDFREETVVADHQAELTEARREHGILGARRETPFDLAARQTDLAILADDGAVGTDQHRYIVDEMAVALDQTDDNVDLVLLRSEEHTSELQSLRH